jgi:hypothetical protein
MCPALQVRWLARCGRCATRGTAPLAEPGSGCSLLGSSPIRLQAQPLVLAVVVALVLAAVSTVARLRGSRARCDTRSELRGRRIVSPVGMEEREGELASAHQQTGMTLLLWSRTRLLGMA